MNAIASAIGIALSRSASSRRMFGDLPPGSSVTRFIVAAPSRMIDLPTATEPVNEIFAPDSMRRFREKHPDAELQLNPAASLEQLEAIRSGRLDAGFVNFIPNADPELNQLAVGDQHVELAVPKRHPLTKLKKLRLRDLVDAAFVWFPRWAAPAFYDQMMEACYRGGLKSPRIVQERLNEATILSLVSTGLGVGWVLGSARWRSPATVVILPVADLNVTLRLALAWRRDNTSPLLASFIGEVGRLPDVRALNIGRKAWLAPGNTTDQSADL
jgi:DNA-binding transcriptional LysR family regulator